MESEVHEKMLSPRVEIDEMGLDTPRPPPKQPFTITLLFAVFIATFGTWLPVGYNYTATNGPQTVIVNWIRSVKCQHFGGVYLLTPYNDTLDANRWLWCHYVSEKDEVNILKENTELSTTWSLTTSGVTIGGLISTFISGFLSQRFGPKITLLANNVLLIFGTGIFCLAVYTDAYELLIAGRIVVGFSLGVICVVTPIYASEITPVKYRGAVGTTPLVMYVVGMVAATVVGLPQFFGNKDLWMWIFVVQLIPVVSLLLFLPFCPESPRRLYLELRNYEAAEKALRWLRRTDNVKAEMLELKSELSHEASKSASLWDIFRNKYYRNSLVLCAVPMFAQQFSGYGCVAFYSTAIFSDVGLDRLTSVYASIGLWVVYLVFALLCMVLVDRAGRRTLLLVSHGGMILALTAFVVLLKMKVYGYWWMGYASAACVPLFIASYATGSSSIAWILPSELFSQEARASGMTLIAALCWGCAMVTTFVFPIVVALTEEYTFLIFVGCVVAATVYVFLRLPETKGKTVEQVQSLLHERISK